MNLIATQIWIFVFRNSCRLANEITSWRLSHVSYIWIPILTIGRNKMIKDGAVSKGNEDRWGDLASHYCFSHLQMERISVRSNYFCAKDLSYLWRNLQDVRGSISAKKGQKDNHVMCGSTLTGRSISQELHLIQRIKAAIREIRLKKRARRLVQRSQKHRRKRLLKM